MHAGGCREQEGEDGGQREQRWRVSVPEMEDDEDDEHMGQGGRVTGQGWRMRRGLGGESDEAEWQIGAGMKGK